MALSQLERTNIIKLGVALFNAAPGAAGLSDLTNFYETNGRNLGTLANVLNNNNTFKALYPSYQTNDEFATSILSTYSLQSNQDAKDFVAARIKEGLNKAQIALAVGAAINDSTATTGDLFNARVILNNKASVAENYSVALSGQSTNIGVLQGVLSGVTSDTATIATANKVNAGALNVIQLTTGLDNLVGTAADNIFTANVVQNVNGEQTNQLATGDKINGGAGIDTLNATVQQASALNTAFGSSITPITTSVEQTFFTALSAANVTTLDRAETVNINAKSMTGLTKVGSVQSDASLLIQNLTTLTDTGVYADRRNTDSITVRMDHSGNDRAPNVASNMTTLFDNDYLLSNSVNSNRLELRLANNLPLKNTFQPLAGFASVSFKVGAVDVTTLITAPVQALTGPAAYTALKVLIDAQLASQGITNVTTVLLNQETTIFSIPLEGNAQGSVAGVFTPIQVVSTGGLLGLGTIQLGTNLVSFNGVNTETLGVASVQLNPITSNIELLKVGRGSDGGSLVVGAMGTDLANNLNFSTTALKQGVEQFNIVVSGDTTQMSSLSNLSSTNNTLQIVKVDYVAGTLADLIIGNKNTAGVIGTVNGDVDLTTDGIFNVSSVKNLALKDVKTFIATDNNTDATNPTSVQTNDVTLNAYLSDQVVAKYLNRVDTASDAKADNANFVITTGSGNDVINLNISKTNLAALGTASREDFAVAINAGAGNNSVITQIGDGVGTDTSNWFINQTINKNLSIVTGAGNDLVRVNGAGSWTINTGDGNDVIYSDNSGRQVITLSAAVAAVAAVLPTIGNPVGVAAVAAAAAVFGESNATWVFNTANQAQDATSQQFLSNLQSATAVAAATKVANVNLTVNYRGLVSTVALGDTALAAGGSVDDLSINQAIKLAINGNVYLQKLLVAQDGPGRTLVVTSVTDGVFSDADLTIALAPTATAISAAQTTAGAAYLTAAQLAALGFSAAGTFIAGGRFDSAIADDNSNFVVETAVVTFGNIGAAGGTETIGGLSITGIAQVGGFSSTLVAQVALGGTVAGLTLTGSTPGFVASAIQPANLSQVSFTSVGYGNVTDIAVPTVAGGNNANGTNNSGAGGTAPTSVTTQGFGNPSIVGAVSKQANANVIDAGLGLDTVILSSAGVSTVTGLALAKETVNVANVVPDADVVFNAGAGSTITVDILDTVISTKGFVLTNGSGTVSFAADGSILGTAGNNIINASTVAGGLTVTGGAGNDTIIASLLGGTVIGGAGSDTITFAANSAADVLVFNSLIGADTINGFNVANDVILVSKAVYTALAGAVGTTLTAADFESNITGASTGTAKFIYNQQTGALNYDADGVATTIAAVLVGTFTNTPVLTGGSINIIA